MYFLLEPIEKAWLFQYINLCPGKLILDFWIPDHERINMYYLSFPPPKKKYEKKEICILFQGTVVVSFGGWIRKVENA